MSDQDGRQGGSGPTGAAREAPTRRIESVPPPDEAPDETTFAPLAPGTVLNNTHRIERLVARGGMGQVYRATNLLTGDAVAVKVIRSDLVNDPQVRALFLREAGALRRIRHPAIVAYEGVHAEASGRVYLAMEFIEGPSLARHIAEQPLTVAQVDALRRRLAEGLCAAHEQNIVHRDLSPDNVVLPQGDLGQATIIDFGIAKKTDGASTSIIGSGFAGKIEYASPEQMGLFDRIVDQRSDVYSLGLVLAAAALGRPLGMAATPADAIAARQRLPDLSPLPAPLRPALTAMLQPDPARRLQSMRQVLALPDTLAVAPRRAVVLGGRRLVAAVIVVLTAIMMLGIARPDWLAGSIERVAALGRPSSDATRPAGEDKPSREVEPKRRADPATQANRDCPQCPLIVRLPPGAFLMGAAPGEYDRERVSNEDRGYDLPLHNVTIGSGFSMGQYETTRGEFAAFVRATSRDMGDSCWLNPGFEQTDSHPVVCVSWDDANAYVAWLTQITGKRYRLPSEAEWEYAARAGTTTARYWGDSLADACKYANVSSYDFECEHPYFGSTSPAGYFLPNAFGLYDMLGNALEWTADCWIKNHQGAPPSGVARLSGDCSSRVIRGGATNLPRSVVRAAARSPESSDFRKLNTLGFRVARSD